MESAKAQVRAIPEDRIKNIELYVRWPEDEPIEKYLDMAYESLAVEITAKLKQFGKYRLVEVANGLCIYIKIEIIVPWPKNDQ